LYLANITDYSEKDYLSFYIAADDLKKQEIDAFRQKEDKQRSLLSNDMLMKLLTASTQQKVEIQKNKYGKKYLTSNEIFFNISHSGNWILIGISNYTLGVDIERIEILDFISLSTFFSKPEQDYLKSVDTPRLKNEFYRIWTANESYVKFLGKGLSIPLNSFVVPLTKNDNLVLNLSRDSRENSKIQSFFLEDYSISICSQKLDYLSFHYYHPTDEIIRVNNNKNYILSKIKPWQ
ncbi:4'-phosphopantetheinyl transferase family protein, partial [Bacillus paramobilis]